MKIVKRILLLILIIALISVGTIVYLGHNMYKKAISEISISNKIEQIQNKENYIKLQDLPDSFKNAVIAVEDHRFRHHAGFDIISTTRAVITNVKDGELSEGGSTITQQLAKNLYFTQEKQFVRKIAELFVAFDIERNYSKDDILELYVNTIYYGSGYTGIQKASKGYYSKEPKDLTLYEATMLAGLPNAPSAYSPKKNISLAHKRQNQVLSAMVKNGYLSEEEKNNIHEIQKQFVK